MNGLFDLSSFEESVNKDSALDQPLNENAPEFKDKCPSSDPETHFDADNSGEKGVSIPGGDKETPNTKPADENSVAVPGGDSEKPTAKPYDETPIKTASKVGLTADQYNQAIQTLQKSFKEATEMFDLLANSVLVEKSEEELLQEAYDDAYLNTMMNGPIYEKVERSDKDDVKNIVNEIRDDVISFVKDQKYKAYKPKLWARALAGFVSPFAAAATIQQIWSTRLWQVIGIACVEAGNTKDLAKELDEKFSEQLGDYKILFAQAPMTFLDFFRTKFGWKNQTNVFFILVDKKMPAEINKATKAADEAYEAELKKKEGEGKEDNK